MTTYFIKVMKCIIEGNGVKVFGKAVHALSRIGEEIWLDPLEKGLAVRTVNKTHSAYACFLFSPMFFQHFTSTSDQRLDNKSANCKVSLKSVLPLFRSITTLERSVYRCEITINFFDSKVIFQFKCRNGITKTHNLGYQECEVLQAVFPAHLCPNILKANPKLLSDIVMHFPVSQEEITLSISTKKVTLKNYYEEDDRIMYTEMFLHPDEFDYFHLKVASDITFCLKELRGLLTFAEFLGLQLSVHFGSPGNFEDMFLEAVVVLATLMDPVSKNPSQVSVGQEAPAHSGIGVSLPSDLVAAKDVTVQLPVHWVGEQVASSQGSPIFRPAYHICSLLFGAITNDPIGSNKSELPSLVYASDTEDDDGDKKARREE